MSEQSAISRSIEQLQLDQVADAFRVLSDPIRIAIIAALVKADRINEAPLTFAELRRAVDIRDSGRFNYHLQQLQPRFVRSTEDGYYVRHAGQMAYSLVQARTAPADQVHLAGYVDRSCLMCGEELYATYENDRFMLTCKREGCYEDQQMSGPFPPAVAQDCTLDELLSLVESYYLSTIKLAADGHCDECWGPMSIWYERPALSPELADTIDLETAPRPIQTMLECGRCEHRSTVPLRILLSIHPAVGGFHYDLGIDLSTMGMLERFSTMAVADLGIEDDGAWIRFEQDGAVLEVVVDDDLELSRVEKSPH